MRRTREFFGRNTAGNRRDAARRLFEALEVRTMMSANTVGVDLSTTADAALADVAANTEVTPLASSGSTPVGYTPAQIASAYGFNSISFGGVTGNGAGQTIAIVDAYDDPNIASDLATFDSKFNLPTANFTKVEQLVGGVAPQEDPGWSMEISLDVEWAHAMAPDAKIELIEANQSSLSDLLSSVQYAASQTGVSVVSMSWGSSEFNGETSYNSYFTTPSGHTGVTFVASSGDSGAGALWPAISTNVLAVGGTTLNLSGSTYSSETAWSDSGGGKSQYQGEASYQEGVQTSGAAEDPDVSYDANPNTGFAVYDSVPDEGYSGWVEVGGTSAGAPQWSALVAIADQGRVKAGENTLTNAAAAVFSLPSSDFHDVTSGSNGEYSATKGYDEVTGLGSPIANLVAQGLVGTTTAQQSYTTATLTTTTHQRGGFFGGGSRGGRFDDVSDDSDSSLLNVGVTFNSAAGATSGASSALNANSQVVGAASTIANWATSGTLNQQSGGLANSDVSIGDNEALASDSADSTDLLGARVDATAGIALANGSSATSQADDDLATPSIGSTALPFSSKTNLDSTTRGLIDSLDALFGSDHEWSDSHTAAADVPIVVSSRSAAGVVVDENQVSGAAIVAVGLALSALWSRSEEARETKPSRPSLRRSDVSA